jgi:hypothetical protein
MSFRTTIIAGVILLALGLYAYFYEIKGGEKREEQKTKEKLLLQVKKEDVAEIRIDGLEQPVKIVPEKEDIWNMLEPVRTRADESGVSRILASLSDFKYRDLIEKQPKNLAQYGLDKPKLTVHVVLKHNKGEKTVIIGAKSPVDNVYYTRVNNDPRVYTVESAAQDLASITLFDLRDKKLTEFDTEKVSQVALHQGAVALDFQKEAGVWKMKRPLESPAAESEVTSLLSSLGSLRATKFIDQPADLDQYGLKSPVSEIDVVQEKGLQQKVLFGNKEGDQIYCLVEGGSTVALVSDSFSTFFSKRIEDWRERKLLIFNRFDAEEVRIHAQGKDYSFKKAGKEEKWTLESPVKKGIDSEKMQDLLEKLETAEISKYGDKPALDGAPSLEFSATMKDWQDKVTKKHLVFGAAKDNLQEVKNDDYNTIVLTAVSLQSEIEHALTDLASPPPPPQTSPTKK